MSAARKSNKRDGLSLHTVFVTVVILTVLSLVIAVVLSVCGTPSEAQRQMIETCSTCWKLGFGAVVGMIGAHLHESHPRKVPA